MAIRLRNPFSRHHKPPPAAEAPAAEQPASSAVEDSAPVAPCPHTVLVPRWDDPADMGKEDRASNFQCQVCGESISPEEALALRATEADRLKRELGISNES